MSLDNARRGAKGNINPTFLSAFMSGNVRVCRYVPRSCCALTQDVPDDALALGRSRQVVKQGWATRLRGLKALGKKKG